MAQDDFLEVQKAYLQELAEQIEDLEGYFLQYEKNSDPGLIRSAMSLIHSMKGTSGSYMMNELSTFCHKVEDLLLDEVVLKDKKFPQLMFSIIDISRSYTFNFDPHKPQNLIAQLDQKLADFSLKHTKKCLILEMSKSMTAAYSSIVKRYGFNISLSRDSFEGLKRLVLEDFDLVILSTNMNSFDGISLYNAAKAIVGKKISSTNFLVVSTKKSSLEKMNEFRGGFLLKDNSLIEQLDLWMEKNFGLSGTKHLAEPNEKQLLSLDQIKDMVFIDDSEAILNLAQHIFKKQKEDITVHYFNSPQKALEHMSQNPPDLIVCDFQMDEMDGIRLKEEIDNNQKLSNIPFLFLTGERELEVLKKMESFKSSGIIKKPFNHQSLLHEISAALVQAA